MFFYKYSSNSDKYLQRFNLQTEEISLGKRNQMNQACSLFNDAQHHELNILRRTSGFMNRKGHETKLSLRH